MVYSKDKKIIFWNVDTQKDFMLPNGKLYIIGAGGIIPNLAKLTQLAKKYNLRVINTGDYHTKETKEISETPDFVNTFPSHCIVGTEGMEFISETYPSNFKDNNYIVTPNMSKGIDWGILERARNITIYKDAFNAFEGNPRTEDIFIYLNPSEVIIYGVTLDYCVKYAIEEILKYKWCPVFIVKDAVKAIVNSSFDDFLKQGALLINTDEIEKEIIQRA
jgi:nicotinamidase/pyrazinamidase